MADGRKEKLTGRRTSRLQPAVGTAVRPRIPEAAPNQPRHPAIRGFRRLVALAALCVLVGGESDAAAAPRTELRVDPGTAVPGQIVTLSGRRLLARGARVTIGALRARVTRRERRRLLVVVPSSLGPGVHRVAVRSRGRRLAGQLQVSSPFTGRLRVTLDEPRASSAAVGPSGGQITAVGSDGTAYELTIPDGALQTEVQIALTPLASVDGLPGSDRQSAGVHFGPDGLGFAKPATLRITSITPSQGTAGFSYSGDGTDATVEFGRAEGSSRLYEIHHFSGLTEAVYTEAGFRAHLAQMRTRSPFTDADVVEFFEAWAAFAGANPGVDFGWCDGQLGGQSGDPNCIGVLTFARHRMNSNMRGICRNSPDELPSTVGPLLTGIGRIFEYEGYMQLVSRPLVGEPEACRALLTGHGYRLVQDTARSDPLGISGVCADAGTHVVFEFGFPVPSSRFVVHGDVDGDGKVREVECALYVAGLASQQNFGLTHNLGIAAATDGLQKVLDDGKELCDDGFFDEGGRKLRDGLTIAVAAQILHQELGEALEECVPRVVVTPDQHSVEVGKTATFHAETNDPRDTNGFRWSSSRGRISQAGELTAPDRPGALDVTAESRNHSDRKGEARVTVTCPAGQVEFQGECRELRITIDPTSATLSPGGRQTFTARLENASDPRVIWDETGPGSIAQAGPDTAEYTAPSQPGTYTVTVASLQDGSKRAQASVTVQGDGVTRVRILPGSISLRPGQSFRFRAEVTGGSDQGVTWSATGNGGTIGRLSGLFTADSTDPGHSDITATSREDLRRSATVHVGVGTARLVSRSSSALARIQASRCHSEGVQIAPCRVEGSEHGTDPFGYDFDLELRPGDVGAAEACAGNRARVAGRDSVSEENGVITIGADAIHETVIVDEIRCPGPNFTPSTEANTSITFETTVDGLYAQCATFGSGMRILGDGCSQGRLSRGEHTIGIRSDCNRTCTIDDVFLALIGHSDADRVEDEP